MFFGRSLSLSAFALLFLLLVYEDKISILSFVFLTGSVSASAFLLRGLQGSIYSSKATIQAPRKSILRSILFFNILFGAMEASFLIFMFLMGVIAGVYVYNESLSILWMPVLVTGLIIANYYLILNIRRRGVNLRIWKQSIGLAHNASQMIIAYVVVSFELYAHYSIVIPMLFTSIVWIILFRNQPLESVQSTENYVTFFPFRVKLMALVCGKSALIVEKETGKEVISHNRMTGLYAKKFLGERIIEKKCAKLMRKIP